MLQGTTDRGSLVKRISVRTGRPALTALLQQLLHCWGFELCPDEDAAALLLVEAGSGEPLPGQPVVWLDAAAITGDRLRLPLRVEALWQLLEQRFHRPPRMHMRLAVDLAAKVLLRGAWQATHLSSLSDRGARFSSDRELVRQEAVTIELTLDRVPYQYHGEIIFSMPGSAGAEPIFQAGVVFSGIETLDSHRLRAYLIRCYLQQVRDRMERQLFRDGLASFDLDPEVRAALAADRPPTS